MDFKKLIEEWYRLDKEVKRLEGSKAQGLEINEEELKTFENRKGEISKNLFWSDPLI